MPLFSTCDAMSTATFGPRLEVRADDADRNPPLRHDEPVRKRPRAQLPLERLERRGRAHARRDRLEPAVVETEPVERARVEPSGSGLQVELVRGEDLGAALGQERDRAASVPPRRRRA